MITAEEIGRSGVRTIAEALRLAPGVEVARNEHELMDDLDARFQQ